MLSLDPLMSAGRVAAHGKGKKHGHSVANTVGVVVVVLLFAALLYGFFSGAVTSPRRRSVAPAGSAAGQQAQQRPPGQPWEYDPVTDQHYNPLPGHQHWHQGKPPAPGEQGRPLEPDGPVPGSPEE